MRTAGTVAADIGKLKKIEDCLKVGKDIAKPVARFSKQKLGQQIQEHNNFLKTFLDHLRKYRQQPGNTVGEVNRIERQLEAYRKILELRGVLFDDLGNAIHP